MNVRQQFRGIYIGKRKNLLGESADRLGKAGVHYGMTGIFTQQPMYYKVGKPEDALWTFCPDGTWASFTVFFEDIYHPVS